MRLALLLAALVIGSGSPVSVTWPSGGGPLRVLFVGDSLTDGAAAVNWRNQFREKVMAGLAAHGPIDAIQRGKGGVKTAYWLTHQLPPKMDLAIVELGTNDAYGRAAPTMSQLAEFDTAYRHLIARIRGLSPAARFVCLGVWHPAGQVGSAAPYDAIVAKDCPGAFIRISDLGANKAHLGADGFHPNDAAHELIAARVLRAIHVSAS